MGWLGFRWEGINLIFFFEVGAGIIYDIIMRPLLIQGLDWARPDQIEINFVCLHITILSLHLCLLCL